VTVGKAAIVPSILWAERRCKLRNWEKADEIDNLLAGRLG
jgi:hypothetical protein